MKFIGQTYVTRNSQDAVAAYQPVYEKFAAMVANSGQLPGTFTIYDGYDDFLDRGSALVGQTIPDPDWPEPVTVVRRRHARDPAPAWASAKK
jgi:hypothetical protein